MNKIVIFHLFIKETTRAHLTFDDTDLIKNIYLVPHAYLTFDDTDSIKNIYLGPSGSNEDLFDGKKIHDIKDIYDVKKINELVDIYKPIAVITSTKLVEKIYPFLKEKFKSIYYIPHSYWNVLDFDKLIRDKNLFYYFTKAFIPYRYHSILTKNEQLNYCCVQGLTQIDYLLKKINLDEKRKILHKSNKKCILFVASYKENEKIYNKEFACIIKLLNKLATKLNLKIYIKPKPQAPKSSSNIAKKQLETLKNENIEFIDPKLFMYDYFFCDLIIVQTCGTAFIESLILNKPTILCQILNHADYIDVKKYKNILQANDIASLSKIITTLHNDNYKIENENYENERQKYIKENIGELENVTEKITQTIIKDNCIL